MHIFHTEEEIKMNISDKEKMLNKLCYQDSQILDFRSKYFGDEINLYIEKDKINCYKLTFLQCYKVSYETDANLRWEEKAIKDLKIQQIGYYAHDIVIQESKINNFIDIELVLLFLFVSITCKDIKIEEVSIKEENFFWNINN